MLCNVGRRMVRLREIGIFKMKLGMTGSSTGITQAQLDAFLPWYRKNVPIAFHHGDCIGADEGICWLIQELTPKVAVCCHPPTNSYKRAYCDYDTICAEKDYLDRNHDIVDASDIMIAFPKEMDEILRSGTWATIRYAKKQDKKLFIFWPDGETDES